MRTGKILIVNGQGSTYETDDYVSTEDYKLSGPDKYEYIHTMKTKSRVSSIWVAACLVVEDNEESYQSLIPVTYISEKLQPGKQFPHDGSYVLMIIEAFLEALDLIDAAASYPEDYVGLTGVNFFDVACTNTYFTDIMMEGSIARQRNFFKTTGEPYTWRKDLKGVVEISDRKYLRWIDASKDSSSRVAVTNVKNFITYQHSPETFNKFKESSLLELKNKFLELQSRALDGELADLSCRLDQEINHQRGAW